MSALDEFSSSSSPSSRSSCLRRGCAAAGSFAASVLSHAGVATAVVAYCLLGAVVFERLERDYEVQVKTRMRSMRLSVTDDIWAMTENMLVLREDEWSQSAEKTLKAFETDVIAAIRKDGWNGDENPSKTKWTFAGSLFYSLVCITTIGYGDQTPKTSYGKVVTIVYAILGIPLMLVCLTNMGNTMATSFRFVYWRVCCFLCTSSPTSGSAASRQHQQRRVRERSANVSLRQNHRASVVRNQNEGTMLTQEDGGSRRVSSTLRPHSMSMDQWGGTSTPVTLDVPSPSTLGPATSQRSVCEEENRGQGDDSLSGVNLEREDAQRESKKSQRSEMSAFSLSLPASKRSSGEFSWYGRSRSTGGSVRSNRSQREGESAREHADDMSDFPTVVEVYPDEEEDIRKKDVPLWICGLLVLGYVLGGSFLFTKREGWSFIDSAYFSFVTLTTIGFGDFVPKAEYTDEEDSAHVASIAICAVYIILGMSLLVMTFNLVQERVLDTVRKVAHRLGIIKDEDMDHASD